MRLAGVERFFVNQQCAQPVIDDDLDSELDCTIHCDDHLWDHTPTVDKCNYRDCKKSLTAGNRKIEVRETGLHREEERWGYCRGCYEKLKVDRIKHPIRGAFWRSVLVIGAREPNLRSTR